MLYTVLLCSLFVGILQLQPANGSPHMCSDDLVRMQDQILLSADALIHRLKVFVKVRSYILSTPEYIRTSVDRANLEHHNCIILQEGLKDLRRPRGCDHLQKVLTPLRNVGKITLSTSGPPEPDQSLFNNPEFWNVTSVLHSSGELQLD